MTSKKAASFCIALGTALALFGAAAGLNRPTEKDNGPSIDPTASLLKLEGVGNTNSSTEQPVRVISAQMPVIAPAAPVAEQPAAPAQNAGQSPVAAKQQAAPAKTATEELREPATKLSEGRVIGDLVIRDKTTGQEITIHRTAMVQGLVLPGQGVAPEGPMPRDASGCTLGNQDATEECGEEAWHMDGDANTVSRDGYSFTDLGVTQGTFAGGQPFESVLTNASLPAASNICGATVGIATNNTALHRIRLRIYTSTCGAGCTTFATSPASQPALVDVQWCTPGAPRPANPPDGVFFLFPTTQFAPVAMPAGGFSYRISVFSDYPRPLVGNGNGPQHMGTIIACPGFDEATGAFPQNNGSDDSLALYGDNDGFTAGLGFGGNTYAGMWFTMHTRDYLQGKVDPDKSSTTMGDETAPFACDIAGAAPLSTCGTANGVVDTNDAQTLANLIIAFVGTTPTTGNRCADVDRNNRIDCNDWRTFAALCGQGLAVPPTMSAPLPGAGDPVYGNITCQPNVVAQYNSGGTLGVPGGEQPVLLPSNIPDNNFTGVTNTQTNAASGTNGIGDLDVDLDITHTNNCDVTVKLIHSNITRTIVNQVNGRLSDGSFGFQGFRCMLDDGEQDGSNAPGGFATAPAKWARTNFRLFGRYKPEKTLNIFNGRRYGGAGNGTGTGVGDWRLNVSDRAFGDTGAISKWSLHVRLGSIISGIVDGGTTVDGTSIKDKYRTLSCQTANPLTDNTATYFSFGQPAGIDASNPLTAIPANFFDQGSGSFTGTIRFEGQPLDPFVSDADMIIRRLGNIQLTVSGACSLPIIPSDQGVSCAFYRTDTMNLRSCQPIQVSYADRSFTEMWDVATTVNEIDQLNGRITLYPTGAVDTSTGGNSWSLLSIRPVFTFSQTADPNNFVKLDTAATGLGNGDPDLELTTGDENPATPSPGCATASPPTRCRIPYVSDPDRAGQALGANPNGIVPGDASFVPNVTTGLAPFASQYTALSVNSIPSGVARNWFRIAVRAPKAVPPCPSVPASTKTLPKELVVGTWGFGGTRIDLPQTSGACQLPVGTASTFPSSDCNGRPGAGISEKRIDRFNTGATPIQLSQVRWVGAYFQCGYNNANALPNNVDDPPLGPGFVDNFTIEFWRDEANPSPATIPAANFGSGSLVFQPVGNGATRVAATGLSGLPADFSLTGITKPIRKYNYSFTYPFGGEPTLPAGNVWISIYNNTALTLCQGAVPSGFTGFWSWMSNTGGGLGLAEARRYSCTNTSISTSGRLNMGYCLATASITSNYAGSGRVDTTCPQTVKGLSYLIAGSQAGDGVGSGQLRGLTSALPTLAAPFVVDRWNNVGTTFKAGNTGKYEEQILAGSPAVTAPSVKTALQTLLTTKGIAFSNCQLDAIIAALAGTPGSIAVDRIFAGQLNFDSPTVTGSIEQDCRQTDGQVYGGPANTVQAVDALKNNLSVFGIGLVRNRTGNFPAPVGGNYGVTAFYVTDQAKDCNLNGRDDSDDIACGLGNTCGGLAGSGDCNNNGIPDECEVPPLGSGTDCDGNLQPDTCQASCLQNGIIDPCNVPPVSNAHPDCDANKVPDECQTDCDNNGTIDPCELPPVSNIQTDCNSNQIPDNCETQGAFVAPLGTVSGVVGGEITFESPTYTLGVLQTGLPTSGPSGAGAQAGWKTIVGSEITMPGFGGATPTTYPGSGQGCQIVLESSRVPLAPCTQPWFAGQCLLVPTDALNAVGNHGVWSYGALSPKMRNRTQGFTRFEISMEIEPGANENDLLSMCLVSDNGQGFANPLAPPVIIGGVAVGRVANQDPNPTFYMYSSDPSTAVVQIVSFGDIVPEGACIRWRFEVDGVSPVGPNTNSYYLDVDGNGFVLTRQSRPLSVAFGPVPVRFAVGRAQNANTAGRTSATRIWWDNAKFTVGTAFSPALATCGGSGTKNGCRIKNGEPDCNYNQVPDACDISTAYAGGSCVPTAGTYATPTPPVTNTSASTTQPCYTDCNGNGKPDDCEVASANPPPAPTGAASIRMQHTFEQTVTQPPPFFSNVGSIIGQPTVDPLVAPVVAGDVTATGIPAYFVPVIPPDTLPDVSQLQVSTANPCPVAAGNEQSIGLFVDVTRKLDGTQPYTVRSGVYNKPITTPHGNIQRFTTDMKILDGRATYIVRPLGDDPQTVEFARLSIQRVRLARAGVNYSDDFNNFLAPQGYLPTNQVQVQVGALAGGGAAYAALLDPNTNAPVQWPLATCFRLIIETDTGRPNTPAGQLLDKGSNVMVGVDTNFDDVPETFLRVGMVSTQLMRGVDLVSDNVASGDPTKSGAGFFDNVTIKELNDFCNSPGCVPIPPPTCGSVEPCLTCVGDVNGDNAVRGNDVQGMVKCRIAGPSITTGCGCADMNADTLINAADYTLFVNKVLGIGDPNPACP